MADRFQFARGSALQWSTSNPVLLLGEIGFVTDTGLYKIGDGSTAWNSLPYSNFAGTFNSLALNNTTDPSAPIGGVLIYSKDVSGRSLPKFVGPAGLDSIIQPAIFGNGVRIAGPGVSTALTYFGMGSFTAVGTVSHPALVSGTLREQTSRGIVTSAATANSASELRYAATQCWRGDAAGYGGFFAVFRFGASDLVSTKRIAVGLWAATSATSTSIDPSTLVNGVWIGNDAADTNLQLMYNDGAGTASKIDLGSNFVKNQQNGVYELILFCKPNDSKISYRVKRFDAAGETSGDLTTDIPSNTTFLTSHLYSNNGGAASAVILDFYRYYLESDY